MMVPKECFQKKSWVFSVSTHPKQGQELCLARGGLERAVFGGEEGLVHGDEPVAKGVVRGGEPFAVLHEWGSRNC